MQCENIVPQNKLGVTLINSLMLIIIMLNDTTHSTVVFAAAKLNYLHSFEYIYQCQIMLFDDGIWF